MKYILNDISNEKLKKLDIKKYTKNDLLYLRDYSSFSFQKLEKEIEEIGRLSSEDQKLYGTLTSINNIIDQNYTLYCLIIENNLIGILKIGSKNLYLYDKKNLHYQRCTCVLDFYILNNFQKMGLGIKLFNFMLKDNNIAPSKLCYDNPSKKLQNFLKKYFSPCNLIKQPNNFVIFSEYFDSSLEYFNRNYANIENRNENTMRCA
ncbi:alpha-tubulin N-acetyltransferase, putative [Plasmodium gallinaceum]|uniref:Alpha-tubulin N-acetyltransferase n=1 Tax=Plasmodium gallinaceum TaxID=5849 RepID=A0A1J1GWH9_PLAGA|nr:alpha-tubulin N-acetyltransferase, putative [Plasmodium gallinaceum]CRG96796.1 alpha-tubulin N-acetyltransferase, putative [Plasmodium gallinaceum]